MTSGGRNASTQSCDLADKNVCPTGGRASRRAGQARRLKRFDLGISIGAPVAGPGVGQVLEAKLLEDGAAGGQGVDLEILGVGLDGVAGSGGYDGAVEAAASVGGEGAAAVKAGEGAVGVSVEAADADGLV